MRSQTTTPGEVHNFLPGDLVDFDREGRTKDSPGWSGPARVVKNNPLRGQVELQWKGSKLTCVYDKVRRFMDFAGIVYLAETASVANALAVVSDYIQHMTADTTFTLGYYCDQATDTWHPTAETKKQPNLALALEFVTRNLFRIEDAFAVRLGRGVRKLPACSKCFLFLHIPAQ